MIATLRSIESDDFRADYGPKYPLISEVLNTKHPSSSFPASVCLAFFKKNTQFNMNQGRADTLFCQIAIMSAARLESNKQTQTDYSISLSDQESDELWRDLAARIWSSRWRSLRNSSYLWILSSNNKSIVVGRVLFVSKINENVRNILTQNGKMVWIGKSSGEGGWWD